MPQIQSVLIISQNLSIVDWKGEKDCVAFIFLSSGDFSKDHIFSSVKLTFFNPHSESYKLSAGFIVSLLFSFFLSEWGWVETCRSFRQ